MTIWYKTGGYKEIIEPIEIIRETEKQIVYMSSYGKECRSAKESMYENYFPTWQEAKSYLVERAERRLEVARIELAGAEKALEQAKSLEEA